MYILRTEGNDLKITQSLDIIYGSPPMPFSSFNLTMPKQLFSNLHAKESKGNSVFSCPEVAKAKIGNLESKSLAQPLRGSRETYMDEEGCQNFYVACTYVCLHSQKSWICSARGIVFSCHEYLSSRGICVWLKGRGHKPRGAFWLK